MFANFSFITSHSGCFFTGRFFFAVVVYFVAGMIIMRVKFNKTGTDIIPNKEFWLAVPFLVKVSD